MTREDDLVVRLTVPPPEAEVAADRLWSAGATAVGFDETSAGTVLTASFPTAAATRLVAAELSAAETNVELVATDPSWRDVWRMYAQPIEVGRQLVVAPAWLDVAVGGDGDGRTVLRIDPGGCFGSGTHASTRLMLAALDASPPAGLAVLDVGCGSGILSVAAARLGAAAVTAVDVEPEAVEVTAANAAANGVSHLISASATPVEEVAGRYDLALVNVTAGIHAAVGPTVSTRIGPGGRILLAGLLPGQWRHIAGAYPGTEVAGQLSLDGWEGAVLVVPAP